MDINEVHKKLFDLMIQFDDVCTNNNIKYTLHGGSLLGAIREHGFIPWDDDIDTAMTREEFNKLKEVLSNSNEYYIYGDIKKQFRRKDDDSVWVDIFICDYIGNGLCKKIKILLLTILDIMYKDKNSIKLVNFKKYNIFKQIAYKILYIFGKIFTRNFKVKSYQVISEYKFVGNKTQLHRSNDQLNGRNKVFPCEWMNNYTRILFEGKELSVISKYHELLCDCYGENYMTPVRDTRNEEIHNIVRGDVNL